jgi:type VI secretion system protein ImpL
LKETLLTCFRYLLYAAAAMLVVLLVLGFILMLGWPWWVGCFLVLVLLGLWAGALFLRKLLARRREQHSVQQVIEQDDAQLKDLSGQEQSQFKELQQSWKEAVETLRRSHLKQQGNPLYVLPWYLVMGESGSGKTTAISSARLSSPFAEVHQARGISGTRNCDWWFFDQAILLDTAGRYSIPADSARDNEEWQKFLSLLVHYRRREPIHGLIITVAADKLLQGSPEELEAGGKQLRRRMDELMRVLGIRFPVYALVTKCDLVPGMLPFSDRLPEKSRDQPMGLCNNGISRDVPGFLGKLALSVADRLKSLRILMLHLPDRGAVCAGVLLFPNELEGLKPGLDSFMRGAFQENSYQDTPLLRGIYLCSGRQEGSGFPGEPGLIRPQEVRPENSRGLFLHDFFAKILPLDRGLLAPTTRTMEWKSLTRNLGLTSWVLLGIALCGLLSYSFVKNLATIREASAVLASAPELKGNLGTDLATMDRFRIMIAKVEESNRNWWIPRFGLNESRSVEVALKARYCRQFQERFLVTFDRNLSGEIAGFSSAPPDEFAGRYLLHLARRVNLLQARLGGAGSDALSARPLPSYPVAPASPGDETETSKRFGSQYLSYLVWRSDSAELGKEVQLLQSLLQQLFVLKGASLSWVLELANRQEPGPALTLQSFWGGSRTLPGEPVIQRVFTRKGKEYVEGLLEEISNACPERGALEKARTEFENGYRSSCFAAWQRFADWFPKGEERLSGPKEWQVVAGVMASEQGPYFAFLKKTATELEPFGAGEGVPLWLSLAWRYRALLAAGPAPGAAEGTAAGVRTAASDGVKKVTDGLGKLVGQQLPGAETAERQMTCVKAVHDYLEAIGQLAPVAKSRPLAHQLALQLFAEDPAVSKSPFYLAGNAVQRVNALLSGGRGDETFSRLISGPVSFYGTYVRMETACSLQKKWEETVLKEVQGASDAATLGYLLGKEGPVWKFVSASVDPFIGWTPGRGYFSKVALGGSVAFEPGFYAFLTKGAKAKIASATAAPVKQHYNVTIKGLPTDANAESRVKPQSTRLELQCASGPQVIDNLNYPVSKNFVWSPETCSDVLFQIDVGEAILSKRYSGPQGFPEFLQDFPGGRHTFYPKEFPREQQMLAGMGVRYIRVNYQIIGGHDIPAIAGGGAAGARTQTGLVPAKITQCWD